MYNISTFVFSIQLKTEFLSYFDDSDSFQLNLKLKTNNIYNKDSSLKTNI